MRLVGAASIEAARNVPYVGHVRVADAPKDPLHRSPLSRGIDVGRVLWPVLRHLPIFTFTRRHGVPC